MKFIQYILIALIIPSILQASNNKQITPYKMDKDVMRSDCVGILAAGTWLGMNKIVKYPIGHLIKVIGVAPTYFLAKESSLFIMNFPDQVNKQRVKITQK